MTDDLVTASDCVKAIRKLFPEREYAVLEQVANGAGWSKNRSADILAMCLWPSRGLLLHGFEIKVSKQDWRRELKAPEKAEEIAQFCDRWWIVAPPGIVNPKELPTTWGLYEVMSSTKVKLVVAAPELSPKPLTKGFIAAMLRRAAESVDGIVRRERSEAKKEGARDGHGELARELEQAREAEARLRKQIEEFKKVSGIDIDSWNYGNVAKAVKTLTDTQHRESALEAMETEREHYKRRLKVLSDDIAALKSLELPTKEQE